MKTSTHVTQSLFLNKGHDHLFRYLKSLILFLLSFSSAHVFAQNCPTIDGDPGDWPAIYSGASYTAKTLIRDANKSNDDQFTGGSKDTWLISQWAWSVGSTNNKGDISTGGAVLCVTGTDANISFFG